jgi:8'-apo-carotenoid 13,14-cleaving dioxygenase
MSMAISMSMRPKLGMGQGIQTLLKDMGTKGVMKVSRFNRLRMTALQGEHPFLSGVHTPMTEELTLNNLEVIGEIPQELEGIYLRIGPNPLVVENPAAYQWFISDGMVHGVTLSRGKATHYRNRWVRSDTVARTLGEPLAKGPRTGLVDTVNTNIIGHAGKIFALVEASALPVHMSTELDTVTHSDFEGTLLGAYTAHPHRDPETGHLHSICYTGADPSVVRHVVVSERGHVIRDEPVKVEHGPSIHDCALTKDFVLVFDLSVTFSMKTLLSGHLFPYLWNDQHQARLGLLPREGKGSEVIWCDVDPCFVFHPCNAFQTDDGKVVVDLIVYDTMFAEGLKGPDTRASRFERWTVDIATRNVTRTVLDDHPQEFPRYDERLTGRSYRLAYVVPLISDDPAYLSDSHLIKHDLLAGTREIHDFGQGKHPGEFVFVPKHRTSGEDEGWLLGYVIDTTTQTTDLVILDAQKFTGKPKALVRIPHLIPPGFHGNWVANAAV